MFALTISLVAAGCSSGKDDLPGEVAPDFAVVAPLPCEVVGCAGDGIDTSSGAYQFVADDLLFPTGLFALQLARAYRSDRATVGWLGRGWSTVYETTLTVRDGMWTLDAPAGFAPLWMTEAPEGWTISGEASVNLIEGEAQLTWPSGERWRFGASGELDAITSPYGQSVEIQREGGVPKAIVSSQGPRLDLFFEGGRLTSVAADDGRRVAYGYAGDQLVSVEAPGLRESFRYNAEGLLLERSASTGVTQVGYVDGRVVEQSLPSGEHIAVSYNDQSATVDGASTLTYHHDAVGRLIRAADGEHTVTERTYDGEGRLVSATDFVQPGDAVLQALDRVFDERGNVVLETVNGIASTIEYDSQGRVTTIRRGEEETTYEYMGDEPLPSAVVSPSRGRDELAYEDGFITRVVDATAVTTVIGRDALGNPIRRSTTNGSEWSYAFDVEGNVTTTTSPSGRTWTAEWGPRSQLVAERDPLGRVSSYLYDEAGRLIEERLPGMGPRRLRYDGAGLLVQETEPSGAETRYEYDSERQLSTVVRPGDRTWRINHDGEGAGGSSVTTTAPDGSYTVTRLDSIGREIDRRSYEADGTLVEQRSQSFMFDRPERATTVRGDSQLQSVSRYDDLGRLIETTDTLDDQVLSATSYSYEGGRLVSATSGDDEVRYSYDAAGRMVEVLTGSDTWTGAYQAGQLVASAHNGETTTIRYDSDGRAEAFTDGLGTTTAWTFDAADRPLTRSIGSSTASFAWSASDQLVAYHSPDGARWAWEYDAAGHLVGAAEPGDVTTTYEYGVAGVSRIESRGGGHDRDDRFEYDANGRLLRAETGAGTFEYRYDATGRVAAIGSEEWRYDAALRLANVASGDEEFALTYLADGHLGSIVNADAERVLRATWTEDGLSTIDVSDRDPLAIGTDADGRLATVVWDADTAVDVRWSGSSFTVQERGSDFSQSYGVSDDVLTSYSADGIRIDSEQQANGYLASLEFSREDDAAGGRVTFDAFGRPATLVSDDSTSTITYDDSGRASAVLTSRQGESPEQTTVRYDADGRSIDGDGSIVERLFAEDGSLLSPLPSSLSKPLSAANAAGPAVAGLAAGAQALTAPEPRPLDEIQEAIVAATPALVAPVGVADLSRLAEQMVVAEVARLAPRFKVNGGVTVSVPVIDPGDGGAADYNPFVDAAPSGVLLGLLADEAGGGGSLLSRAIDTVSDFVGGVVEFGKDVVGFIVDNPIARFVLSAGSVALAFAACSPPAFAACLPVASLAASILAGDAALTLASSLLEVVRSCGAAEVLQCGLALAETAVAVAFAATAVRLGVSIADVLHARLALAWAVRSGRVTSIASGNLGTARSELLAALRMERVAAREVDVVANGTRARIDLVTRSIFGKNRFVEVKNGTGARLTANQQAVYPILQSAGAYFPNGLLNGGAPQTVAATVIEIQHWGAAVPVALP